MLLQSPLLLAGCLRINEKNKIKKKPASRLAGFF
ncbi:MAG: hypothetical protein RIR12_1049 [Bacteroidota bacterium]|jgi:hypothetical protein